MRLQSLGAFIGIAVHVGTAAGGAVIADVAQTRGVIRGRSDGVRRAGIEAADAGELPALQRCAHEALAVAEDGDLVDVVEGQDVGAVAAVGAVFAIVPIVAVLRGIGAIAAVIGEVLGPGVAGADAAIAEALGELRLQRMVVGIERGVQRIDVEEALVGRTALCAGYR